MWHGHLGRGGIISSGVTVAVCDILNKARERHGGAIGSRLLRSCHSSDVSDVDIAVGNSNPRMHLMSSKAVHTQDWCADLMTRVAGVSSQASESRVRGGAAFQYVRNVGDSRESWGGIY